MSCLHNLFKFGRAKHICNLPVDDVMRPRIYSLATRCNGDARSDDLLNVTSIWVAFWSNVDPPER